MGSLLSLSEQQQLDQQEGRIAHGLQKFHEIGSALLTIRDKRLYRHGYPNFVAYCRQRWGIQKSHAYRLMAAAEVIRELSPIGDVLPRTESQARALSRLDPARLHSVWAELTREGDQPTAAEIEDVIRRSGIHVPAPSAEARQLRKVRAAEAEAAHDAKRIADRDRIAAGERALRKAIRAYEGLGALGVAVAGQLREALALSVQLVP